ncbi:MAG TPA: hypothetical protein VIF09_17690 [Polyangiaceae bacterium]
MGLFSNPAQDWTQAAVALRLPLCPVLKPFNVAEDTVHAIQRKLGPPGQGGHPDQHWLSGEQRGIAYVAGGRTVTVSTSEGTETTRFFHWMAEVDPPLWLGLAVKLRPGNVLSQLFHVNNAQWRAWDPQRMQTIFSYVVNGRPLHQMLADAAQNGLTVEADDHGVRFEREGYAFMPQLVASGLDGVTQIAEGMRAARALLGPARWELDAAAAWTAFGNKCGLKLDAPRLRLSGSLEACKVDVRLMGGVVPKTRLRVRYPNPLNIRLTIVPGNVPGILKFLGAQDITLGDPAFDQAFIVRGNPEAVVKQTVHAGMQTEILGLSRAGATVNLFDDHLDAWFPGLVLDLRRLDELLLRGMAVVRGFWRR